MPKFIDTYLVTVGVTAFIGVVAGAVGAHLLRDRLTPRQQFAWTTAVSMNLIHAVGMLSIVALRNSMDPCGLASKRLNRAFYLLTLGTFLFAGSIYALCLGAPQKPVGPLTPIGGATLMIGWLTVAFSGL